MKVLIFGVSGLIGHTLLQHLDSSLEVYGTLRFSKKYYNNASIFSKNNILENIDATILKTLLRVLNDIQPDVILNCIGITRRKICGTAISKVIVANTLLPHQLADWANSNDKRVIHFSTDCVFDGTIGNYSEKSLTTANDLYGRTKALGEINYMHTITIRSSFIGQELYGKTELLEWILAQNGQKIYGYKNTLYSGVSTIFMAKAINNIILNYPNLCGLYNLAPDNPISKYDLISLVKAAFDLNIEIIPETKHIHTPTLDGSKLKKDINLTVPTWEEMVAELWSYSEFYQSFNK